MTISKEKKQLETQPDSIPASPVSLGHSDSSGIPTVIGNTPAVHLPIVGIGASAGGLEAFEGFFRVCPPDTGMAFVLVPHLDPGHESLLTEILQRSTSMPVIEVVDQASVVANHVYIIPPNREMGILQGVLQLSMPEQARGQRMPIDAFLRSLAEDQAENAVGIILSGTATDGTLGLRAIFGAGGICMVQDPASAKYDGMPRSAIAAGYASHILPVEKMPAMLTALTHTSIFQRRTEPKIMAKTTSGINQVLMQVRSVTGHDFSLYKKSTISRRITRRMAQHNIEDIQVYARYLREHSAEVLILFKELLINVTSFFRDPDAFILLKNEILPKLLVDKASDYVVRIWVAGCATGEEAYSIAILLREYMNEAHKEFRIQIYATDLDDDAIAIARSGCYPPNISQDVSDERLRRFFTKDDLGYKVKKDIREMIVFAIHNVIKDPPFTKLDLLSCRNLLIYLETEQQNRLIPNFHYALKPGGVLFLSSSESISYDPPLFTPLNRKWKFYQAIPMAGVSRALINETLPSRGIETKKTTSVVMNKTKSGNIGDVSNRILLQSYAPASVTTDIKGNILYVHGDTGRYLRPAPGPISNNVVEMAREGLQLELRSAMLNATLAEAKSVTHNTMVKTNSGFSMVQFIVRRLPSVSTSDDDTLLLISFQDVVTPDEPIKVDRIKRASASVEASRVEQLERELAYAKENLQATIEEQQATNEELKSTNEELQSTNEELQSSNEELETSKEELQSLNEETITVNSELNAKIEQLGGVQSDMKNLLDNLFTGTLFLDENMIIRRYTREAQKVYRLIATDVGRPLSDIVSNLEKVNLHDELQTVLETLIPMEHEVRTTDGAWYLLRIQPYRTLENVIAGIVLSFTDVTKFKLASEAVLRSETMLAMAQQIAHLGCWEMNLATGVSSWSDEMFNIFGYPRVATPMSFQDMLNTMCQEDQDSLKAEMQNSVTTHLPYDIQYSVLRANGVAVRVRSKAMPVTDADGQVTRLVGTSMIIQD